MIEMLIRVDEYDNEVGCGEKLQIHKQGLLHRAFSIFIFDVRGRLLLQRRAMEKYHSGGLWTNTCCGHPRPGELTEQAAHRRLGEEMGFDCPLKEVASLIYRQPVPSAEDLIEHEFDHIFIGIFDKNPSPDPSEASAWEWAEIAQLLLKLKAEPKLFTVWFKKIVNELDAQSKHNWLEEQGAMITSLRDPGRYQDQILSKVSRTFALTIPQLPSELSVPVTNAYLLCRIADTIEDEPALTSQQKCQYERTFLEVVSGFQNGELFSAQLSTSLTADTLEAERDLVRHLPLVLEMHSRLKLGQRKAIVSCLDVMTKGMYQFQCEASLKGLATCEDLDRYCYCVAGVVGEMLTEFFIDFDPTLEARRKTLSRLSMSFGAGLQLTNILKDRWEDQLRGVCWLPQDLFSQYGVQLSKLQSGQQTSNYTRAISELIGTAHAHLQLTLEYALLIPAKYPGIRRFILWSVGLALLTLQKIFEHPTLRPGDEYKVSHQGVAKVMRLTQLYACSDPALRKLFKAAARKLPLTPLDVKWGQNSLSKPWPRSSLAFLDE